MSIDTFAVSHDGKAIGKFNNKTWFITHALPNETVEARVLKEQRHIIFAQATKIIKPHLQRTLPPCPQFERCGGCDFQMADYDLQKALKEKIVLDALKRIGGIDMPLHAFHGADELYRYRNKGIFHLHRQHHTLQLSFYAPQTHDPVPASDCLLFSKKVNDTCKALENILKDTSQKTVHQLMIRESSINGALMINCIGKDPQTLSKTVLQKIAALDKVTSIYYQYETKDKKRNFIKHLYGEEYLLERIGKVDYQLSPASFFQTNHYQTEILFAVVKKFLLAAKAKNILDFYCGVGAIGLYLSEFVESVLGIESVTAAVCDAQKTANANNVFNCQFIADKAEKYLEQSIDHAQYDITIVDPPRSGLHESLIKSIFTRDLIYVSCNPVTLARDLARLQQKGYQLKCIEAVDMFPQTAHVECIALIQKM